MEKTLTTLTVKNISEQLIQQWETYKSNINLNAKALYHLIGLKKSLFEEGEKINDTLIQLFTNNECQLNEQQTGFIIPNEKKELINGLLNDLYSENIVIKYEPIIILDSDKMPTELMDILFDFIEFKE